jgi:hypothetical protein
MINKKNNRRTKIIGGFDRDYEGISIVNNFFCYILLYISYILFGIATILFFNACFNLNKTSIDDSVVIFLDQPIYEYLKEDNFMYIDEYLLNIKLPIFITIVSIFSISLFAIFCIWLWRWLKYDTVSIIIPDEIDAKTFYIAILSYIFMIIIIITYNNINDNFANFDKEYNKYITKEIIVEDSSYLKELKKIIIFMLENDKDYISDEDIRSKIELGRNIDSDVVKIAKKIKLNTGDNKKSILKLILDIYAKDYKNDKSDKIKYIKYINYYFDLLINNRKDNYTKYYILGLAKNAHKNLDDLNELNNTFRNILFEIKSKIYVYFILIILLYCLFFFIISSIIYWYYEKKSIDKFIIDISYNIYSITILFSLFFAFILYFVLFYTKKIL